MTVLEQAMAIRNSMNKVTETLTDAQALEVKELYELWKTATEYVVGDIRRYAEKLYRCLQAHTSEDNWSPDVVPALWVEIAPVGEYREIKDNMLATEAFVLGEIGWYQTKDNLFESLIDANVYTPITYPAGWKEVV